MEETSTGDCIQQIGDSPPTPPAKPPEFSPPPTPIDGQKPSFFDLPLHIRRKIYRHAVVPTRLFVRPFISSIYIDDLDRLETYGTPNMALFQVCKRVNEECTLVFYKENVFSFIHVDLFVGLLIEHPRLGEKLKHMHKVELIFDGRDFQYLTDTFCDDLEYGARVLLRGGQGGGGEQQQQQQDISDSSSPTDSQPLSETITQAANIFTTLRQEILSSAHRPKINEIMTTAHLSAIHDHSIHNLRENLWGRTLTFIRQRLLLTNLYLDFTNCYCPAGCCRLAEQVMEWGWTRVWVFGQPNNVSIVGATAKERRCVLKVLARQAPTMSNKSVDKLVDIAKAVHPSKGTYVYRVMREAFREIEMN
ncbi:hypothetical protein AJ80_07179 [Polytolypa hystricis UAMH7299]|uniref:Uncharacterized protein n=1 Tax=Polytolypa hystricis (strain UAMH7299) TaxID=1447883 RepID=A0A2B7XQM9_POLH7|nr:hypothetical protein AJ80_07179 [Polytolypa hystricis UAMH7299]